MSDMSGADLADAVRRAAASRGVPLRTFAAPLSSMPAEYLNQLARASTPKPHTVARIRALLAGEPVPPVPRAGRVAHDGLSNDERAARRRAIDRARRHPRDEPVEPSIEALRITIDRTLCPWCGVRADIGCRHNVRATATVRTLGGVGSSML